MDAIKFSKMLSDKHVIDFKKLKYKYPDDFDEFVEILKSSYYEELPINDETPAYIQHAGVSSFNICPAPSEVSLSGPVSGPWLCRPR